MAEEKVHEIVKFLEESRELEDTFRFSETLKDTKESVADHSWRLTLMTFLISEELGLDIDLSRALKIAIVHDLAEALTGEVDAWHVITGRISKEEKEKNEREAIEQITKRLSFGEKIKALWQEYVDQASDEAKLVKGLDKIEAFLTIYEAGHSLYTKDVFYGSYADDAVRNFPKLEGFLKKVKSLLKQELSKGNIEWKE